MGTATMPTAWRLNELMAKHRVKGVDLAQELGISTNSVASLRKHKRMPRIDGDRLDKIAAALTKLSEIGEKVHGVDLLEERRNA